MSATPGDAGAPARAATTATEAAALRSRRVRLVSPGEAELAGALVVGAFRALLGALLDEGYAAHLADVAGRMAGSDVLVAEGEAGSLLGCVTFVADDSSPMAEDLRDGEAGIRMLAVDSSAQGQGVGRLLTEECLGRARALRRRAVFLHSTPQMLAAHHIYRSLGFERVPERDWSAPDVELLAFRLDLGLERSVPPGLGASPGSGPSGRPARASRRDSALPQAGEEARLERGTRLRP